MGKSRQHQRDLFSVSPDGGRLPLKGSGILENHLPKRREQDLGSVILICPSLGDPDNLLEMSF